mgnify:CR=1 FL=1
MEDLKRVLKDSSIRQIAFVVEDIEEYREKFSKFFGIQATKAVSAGEYSMTETVYDGKPAREAEALLAFLKFSPEFEIELIQPNAAPSIWRDWISEHGEGFHHIAFHVSNMERAIDRCENSGISLRQTGYYSDRSGRYAYLDATEQLKCCIELLESFEKTEGDNASES